MLRDTSTDVDARTLHESLVGLLDANGLYATGGGDRALAWVVAREGSQATDVDRALVGAWANQWSAFADITISDLIDLDRDA